MISLPIVCWKTGKILKQWEDSKGLFSHPQKDDLVWQYVRWQAARRRQGTHHTKGISDISGTTKKPFKQKGTGKARLGSLRAPQCRGGATIFGPKTRSHAFHMNKRQKLQAVLSVFSNKRQAEKVILVDRIEVSSGKTKEFLQYSSIHNIQSALIFADLDAVTLRSCANLQSIKVLPCFAFSVYSMLKYRYLVLSMDSLSALEERLC